MIKFLATFLLLYIVCGIIWVLASITMMNTLSKRAGIKPLPMPTRLIILNITTWPYWVYNFLSKIKG